MSLSSIARPEDFSGKDLPAARALDWVGGESADFLSLSPSHLHELANDVAKAANPCDFMRRLRSHLRKTAKRGKGKSPWDHVVAGRLLRHRLLSHLFQTRNVVKRSRNSILEYYRGHLEPEARVVFDRQRDLAVLRVAFADLVKCHAIGTSLGSEGKK